jgi:quercetin dioxygenase-like cupin family protein
MVEKTLRMLKLWGTRQYGEFWADDIESFSGSRPSEAGIEWWAKKARNACTPDVAEEMTRMWWQTGLRGVLPSVQASALLMSGLGEEMDDAKHAASLMPNARLEVFPSGWMTADTGIDEVNRPRLDAVARLVGLPSRQILPDTILSTILFTDIVDSTMHQARLGDREWKRLIEQHNALIRESLVRWRGHENDTAGDGFYATFDGPARAIHCARETRERVSSLGIEIRAGVHTGECELIDGKCAGIAVSTGARIPGHSCAVPCRGAATVLESKGGRTLTIARTSTTTDDDRVRVTTLAFEDGDETGYHRHAYDYIVVPITGGTFAVYESDGGTRELPQIAGSPYLGRAGTEHNVVNQTGAPATFVEIELKR